jgi:hypothetical protein
VTPLCRIEWTPHISFADLEWTTNTLGEKYKILNFEFEFKTLGATAEFAVYVKGVKQGGEGSSVTIQHDT